MSKDRAGSKDRAWEVAGKRKEQTGVNLSRDSKMTTGAQRELLEPRTH